MLWTSGRVPPSQTDSSSLWSPLPPLWLTASLKVRGRLMSWSLTGEMCPTLQPSCLPPPVIIIIIFSYLLSRRLSLSRSFWTGLEDIPAAVHPPFFSPSGCREVKTSLFQMWEPQGILGIQRIWGYSTVCCEFRQCGVHCVLVKVVFSYYRFSWKEIWVSCFEPRFTDFKPLSVARIYRILYKTYLWCILYENVSVFMKHLSTN